MELFGVMQNDDVRLEMVAESGKAAKGHEIYRIDIFGRKKQEIRVWMKSLYAIRCVLGM